MTSANPAGLAVERRAGTDGRTILALSGYIDLSTATQVGEAIGGALGDARSVEVDLTDVSFVDSSGLREFVLGYQLARNGGQGYRVTGAHGSIRQVLEISGLYDYLTEGVPEQTD